MKIELEVPDELVEGQILFLFAGAVHVAIKRPEKGWMIKEAECNMCGECCSASHINPGLPVVDGWCKYLIKNPKDENQKICGMGRNRPFSCAIGMPKYEPDCSIIWRKAE